MAERKRILLVEDAPEMRLIIRTTLSEFDLTLAGTLAEAIAAVEGREYDLYILDMMLPDGDTLDLCSRLRRDPRTVMKPILFLSGRSAEVDKLNAFSLGADDYITKPFSVLELKARVQAKLRNTSADAVTSKLEFPTLTIDREKRKVYIREAGRESSVKLTKIEFNILLALASRPEVIKTRAALLDEVWGSNVAVTERSVDVHVYNLRKKLGPCADVIQSDHGNGYFFAPPKAAPKAS